MSAALHPPPPLGGHPIRTAARILLRLSAGLLGLVLLISIVTLIVYPVEYVRRVFAWQDADVGDHLRFPNRPIQNGPPNFQFAERPDPDRVQALFRQDAGIDDLQSFLTASRTQAFIVIKDDAILYERYFGDARRDSIVTSFSMAKSFTSALIGIAIGEGHITSVDDPITNYLPELIERDARFQEITVRDLLGMSSGIRYNEFPFLNGDDAKTYYYPDLRELALEGTAIVGAPGESFHYNNFHPLLLGLILERATGVPVAHYLQDKIWIPLGMEYRASWSLDSEDSGFEKMESGINARAIDFARFGRLFLNGGSWNGVPVVPAAWVADSTGPDSALGAAYYGDRMAAAGAFYGLMWWGMLRPDGGHDFYAVGNHGQLIFVSPAKNLVVVRNGESYGDGLDNLLWAEIFRDFAAAL